MKNSADVGVNSILSCMEQTKYLYDRIIMKYEKELAALPKGCLVKKERGSKLYMYHQFCDESGCQKQTYIPKKDGDELIAQLQKKRYLESSLPVLRRNRRAAIEFIRNFKEFEPREITGRMIKPQNRH